jgi:hypothetical protein
MDKATDSVRDMWARQAIRGSDVDYRRWGRDRGRLARWASLSRQQVVATDSGGKAWMVMG